MIGNGGSAHESARRQQNRRDDHESSFAQCSTARFVYSSHFLPPIAVDPVYVSILFTPSRPNTKSGPNAIDGVYAPGGNGDSNSRTTAVTDASAVSV